MPHPRAVAPADRAAALKKLRLRKMARSAHAFVRGSAPLFYEWLEGHRRMLPQAPSVWVCGDCHLSNVGPVADEAGDVMVEIRDLDQTVVGHPAFDLIRMGLSLATLTRNSNLPGLATATMLEHLIAGYRGALAQSEAAPEDPKPVAKLVHRAVRRRWKHLVQDVVAGDASRSDFDKTFWPLTARERTDIEAIAASDAVRAMAVALCDRGQDEQVRLLEAMYWVKGCSSLGLGRYAALLEIGDGAAKKNLKSRCLLDLKEAVAAVAPGKQRDLKGHNADRVRQGALHLSPNLGKRMLTTTVAGRSVFVRELRPQDLKLDLERLSHKQARRLAHYLGMVMGQAHGRQLADGERRRWHASLAEGRPKTLDTPSWFWKAVVGLAELHEGAYLDHCRRYTAVLV